MCVNHPIYNVTCAECKKEVLALLTAPKVVDPGNEVAGVDTFKTATETVTKVRRAGNWTVEQWLDWFKRHPDACAPAYVASLIIEYYEARIHDMRIPVEVT